MIGLGTIVNCGAIIAGTTLGVLLKGGLPRRFEATIMQALGLCTFFIGIGGAIAGLLVLRTARFPPSTPCCLCSVWSSAR